MVIIRARQLGTARRSTHRRTDGRTAACTSRRRPSQAVEAFQVLRQTHQVPFARDRRQSPHAEAPKPQDLLELGLARHGSRPYLAPRPLAGSPGWHAKVGFNAYPCHAREVGYFLGASNRMTNPSAQIMVLARSHINIAGRIPLFGYREST
jgi:hypothetical protein